jgi:exonuclease III
MALLTSDLEKLLQRGLPIVLCGDFNGKYTAWDSRVEKIEREIFKKINTLINTTIASWRLKVRRTWRKRALQTPST